MSRADKMHAFALTQTQLPGTPNSHPLLWLRAWQRAVKACKVPTNLNPSEFSTLKKAWIAGMYRKPFIKRGL
jgi:hypothetical protein